MMMGKIFQEVLDTVQSKGDGGVLSCTLETSPTRLLKDGESFKNFEHRVYESRSLQEDAYLVCNEYFTIRVLSSRSGYLSLFNLGTDGTIEKVFPLYPSINNHIEANVPFVAANTKYCWSENGPATDETGRRDGMLFVLSTTENNRWITLSDLHVQLAQENSRGGLGPVHDGISSLLSRKNIFIHYISFKVLPARLS